jgi:hypothetical protein
MLARRLAAEVEAELSSLLRLGQELSSAPTDCDTFSLRARASILHDFYTGVERIFVRIAEELNGGVPRSEQWHRQILHDMTLELQDVRPAVITSQLAAELGEFLRFRHVFRNVYGFVLEADRMRPLQECLVGVLDRFLIEIRMFNAWMLGERFAS